MGEKSSSRLKEGKHRTIQSEIMMRYFYTKGFEK